MTPLTPPRLGMLHYSCPPIVGGVESVLATHARLFADSGYAVATVVGRGGRFDRRVELRRLPLIDSRFEALEDINAELKVGLVSERFHELTEQIEQTLASALADIDVCIVHNAFTLHFNLPLTVALHRLAAAGHTRFVAWCHDLAWTNPLYLPLMREEEPWTLLKTAAPETRYVTVSEFRSAELRVLLGDATPVETIPNGIDAARFLGLGSATTRLLQQIGAAERYPFLLLPARITRRKNIELAIRIVSALTEEGGQPLLLVTGPPGPHNARSVDYVDELSALADELGVAESVVLLHRLNRGGRWWSASDAMVRELYRVADALVFPSSQEGFGLPVLEAGLARLPVFCASIQPFRDLGEQDLHYFDLDEPPRAIASRILQVLHDRPESRLHRRTMSEYDWVTMFRRQIRPLVDELAGIGEGAILYA